MNSNLNMMSPLGRAPSSTGNNGVGVPVASSATVGTTAVNSVYSS